MSDPGRQPPSPEPSQPPMEETTPSGPNLTLIYSLIALALVTAIGFALMIVMPFYHRH